MQSGKVDNSTRTEAYAVYGLEKVKGESHAGGFAGKVDAGATASSNGLNLLGGILNLDIGQLLDVLQVYIPIIQSAGVKSTEKGFTVEATDTDSYAGGYLGYGGGVQIKDSDVTSLKHTKVTPPGDSLESQMETAISERIHNMQSKVENTPEVMQDVWILIPRQQSEAD